MIAYVTIYCACSSVPLQNRVMISADTHAEIVASIAKMADMTAKSISDESSTFTVDSFDMKRDLSSNELHYIVKLVFDR